MDETELTRENAALRDRVAELEDRIERLETLADTDPLTPLPNRRYFIRAIERAIAQQARHGTPSALLFADVDGLKAINDAHGHAAGDGVLVRTAEILRDKVRSGDVVARIGGDEFGVLLDYTDATAAREKAALLRAAVGSGDGIAISLSIGVTAIEAGDTAVSALDRADREMYRAKRRD